MFVNVMIQFSKIIEGSLKIPVIIVEGPLRSVE